MRHLESRVPSNLNPYARELLEMLRGQPAARHIILGGGVALSHYHEYRETVDVDAWWVQIPNKADLAETVALLRQTMRRLGECEGCDYSEREWGDTLSLELRRAADAPSPSCRGCCNFRAMKNTASNSPTASLHPSSAKSLPPSAPSS